VNAVNAHHVNATHAIAVNVVAVVANADLK